MLRLLKPSLLLAADGPGQSCGAVRSAHHNADDPQPARCQRFAKTWGKAGQRGASRSRQTLSNRPNSRECGRSVGCGAV